MKSAQDQTSPSEALPRLLDRARGGDEAARNQLIDRLRPRLAVMVRLALRRGKGLPPLVAWTKQTFDTLAAGRAIPPEPMAPEITQMLCAALARHLITESSSELGRTVLGV